jgi:hypothetical protein
MKKVLLSLTLVFALGTALDCIAQTQDVAKPKGTEQAQDDAKTKEVRTAGQEVIGMLIKGDFAGVAQKFDGKMQEAMTQEQLREAWTTATSPIGGYKSRGNGQIKSASGYDFITVKCQYEQAVLYVRIAFNNEKKISGLQFKAEAE